MKKHILISIIIIGLMCLVGCGTKLVETDASLIKYKIDGDSVVIEGIVDDNKSVVNFVIPETIEGYDVTVIEDGAFNYSFLRTIHLPSTIKEIGSEAFTGALFLNQITVDKNNEFFTSVNNILFSKDKKVLIQYPPLNAKDFTLPTEIEEINERAFQNSNVGSIDLSLSAITELKDETFENSKRLTEVVLPNGLTKIGNNVFKGTDIAKLVIPASVTEIGTGFSNSSYVSVTFLGDLPSINRINIGYCDYAIITQDEYYDNFINSSTFPYSDDFIFKSSDMVDDMLIEGDTLRRYVGSKQTVTIPDNIKVIGKSAFRNCVNVSAIRINESCEEIGAYAFSNTNISYLDLVNVKKIGTYGISLCLSLRAVYIPNTVETIETHAFASSGITPYQAGTVLYFEAEEVPTYSSGWNIDDHTCLVNKLRSDIYEQ